jgi:hypothetical protein
MLSVLLNWLRKATADAILAGVEDAVEQLADGVEAAGEPGGVKLRARLLALTAKAGPVEPEPTRRGRSAKA